jgi:dUTP pyrophosphatase
MLNVPIQQLEHAEGLELPAYQTSGAAGLDLVCALAQDAPLTLKAGQTALIPTGLVMEIPNGFEAQVRPRSGLAFKHGITVLNAPGTIDSDYRGELKVLLINHGAEDFVIERGMRIAQLVIAPVTQIEWQQTTTYTQTKRAGGGFGSSGF